MKLKNTRRSKRSSRKKIVPKTTGIIGTFYKKIQQGTSRKKIHSYVAAAMAAIHSTKGLTKLLLKICVFPFLSGKMIFFKSCFSGKGPVKIDDFPSLLPPVS